MREMEIELEDDMERKLYIRFGEVPDGEKSGIYSCQEQKIIGSENGVSVYDCCRIGDDWRIVLPTQCKESTLDTLYGLLVDGKDIYVLSGDEVGIGSDNEPLIRNCNVVCKLPNNYFSLLIENEEIVSVTE